MPIAFKIMTTMTTLKMYPTDTLVQHNRSKIHPKRQRKSIFNPPKNTMNITPPPALLPQSQREFQYFFYVFTPYPRLRPECKAQLHFSTGSRSSWHFWTLPCRERQFCCPALYLLQRRLPIIIFHVSRFSFNLVNQDLHEVDLSKT